MLAGIRFGAVAGGLHGRPQASFQLRRASLGVGCGFVFWLSPVDCRSEYEVSACKENIQKSVLCESVKAFFGLLDDALVYIWEP